MTQVGLSFASGATGALTLTAIHQIAQRHLTYAPRMDVVAMRGLDRILPGYYHPSRRLHRLALAGDLVGNSLYYSVVPASTSAATWIRGVTLGAMAGIGALLLPQRIGLGEPPYSQYRPNQIMTVAWYLAGGAAAALAATLIKSISRSNDDGDGDRG
jgi:hypothetical protein